MAREKLFPGLDKPLLLSPRQEEASLELLALRYPPARPPLFASLMSLEGEERLREHLRRNQRVLALRRAIEKIERYQLLLTCIICDEPLVYAGEEGETGVFWFDCPCCEHVFDFRSEDPWVFTNLAECLRRSGWSLLKLLQLNP